MLSAWSRRSGPASLWQARTPAALQIRCQALSSMSASEIRKRFTDYFARNGHARVASANIVPKSDPSLLFTNAGMVPFKQYFMDPRTAPYKLATTVQKCVRAGGKHNDLDQVGYTPRHHTFFEMLGNFSFGAYDKRATIRMAWKFVREELQMPEDMLRVTVLESDHESYDIWKNDIKLDPSRIVRCGPEDNFWSMGSEGPCGPCSEIFWDTKDPRYAVTDDERWLEFWNLVFMQFHRSADGQLTPLAQPCIDTGMGLERVASILQGKTNNFDTDEFQTIIQGVDRLRRVDAALPLDQQAALAHKRIVADHMRASAFLVSEGVHPSNTGRGYVLRRIIRRAVRAGRLLGIDGPVLPALYPSLEAAMGTVYPELAERREYIVGVLRSEEGAFAKTLNKGMALLEGIFASTDHAGTKVVSGGDAFALYDTHGFPVDLTQIIARDNGWTVDVEEFGRIQLQSRKRNQTSWKTESKRQSVAGEIDVKVAEWQAAGVRSRFCGYELDPAQKSAHIPSEIVAFSTLSNGDGLLVIDPCPFYAHGGGQEPDSGSVTVSGHCDTGDAHMFTLKSAVALPNGQATALHLKAVGDKHHMLTTGQLITAAVDMQRRHGSAVHHTATHLLHAALRSVEGDAVKQAGSLVRPDSLRFDFTSSALTDSQLREVERQVNRAALANADIVVSEMPLDEAKRRGAVALFTEKYSPERVRVVEIPNVSMELCSGTHLRSTRTIFPFQIVSEGSIGSGTRRIDAVAGVAASAWLQQQLACARAAARVLDVAKLDQLSEKAQRLSDQNRALRDEAARWLRVAAANAEAVATHATALGAAAVPT
ncbi:hypothetical protein IWW55_002533, partial [Coemansia sp. RSA 2706]